MKAARKFAAMEPREPNREINVCLIDGMDNRMMAIKAVANGELPVDCLSINLWKVKEWALNVNQPVGEVHGFKITEKGKI